MKKLFVYGIAILSILSCKDEPTEVSGKFEYQPNTIGSYWIYDYYEIDEDGTESKLNWQDSVAVSRDTVIDDLEFFVLEGGTNKNGGNLKKTFQILRIENDRLYNERDILVFKNMFSSGDYEIQHYTSDDDTLYSIKFEDRALGAPIEVPAGKFSCAVTEGEVMAIALHKLEESVERENRYTLLDLAGAITFRKKTGPKVIDHLAYGV